MLERSGLAGGLHGVEPVEMLFIMRLRLRSSSKLMDALTCLAELAELGLMEPAAKCTLLSGLSGELRQSTSIHAAALPSNTT
mmetsp:Transcript_71597/g.202121  ORF Transcript_71597/g.202121 Transcript_71597/m.202121 type:complete len:82 (+) Transcript_71597:1536-1781(+)